MPGMRREATSATASSLPWLIAVAALGCCARRPDLAPSVDSAEAPAADAGPAAPAPDPDLLAAGRAFDAGDAARARELLPRDARDPEARWLAARVAAALRDHEIAVALLQGLAGARDDLEGHRSELLARELAAAGRVADALDLSAPLVAGPEALPRSRSAALREIRSDWLERLGRHGEALDELDAARALADRDPERQRLDLRRAEIMARVERKDEARRLLAPLADSAATAGTMTRAARLLDDLGAPPDGSPARRLARARRLAALRAFADALIQIEPMLEDGTALGAEARFERARYLFDRRRHYAEAVEALDAVIAEKGSHVDDARFLRARALSRLDRDEEAIEAYRDFARKTKDKSRAASARFLAARLLYYLGRHEEAVREVERLIGRGVPRGRDRQRLRPGLLTPGQARDAHFIAGMSALLVGDHRRAEDHLLAASAGSDNPEVRERNRYWHAVARLAGGRGDGPELLRGICAADGTSWYSLWARSRLSAAGMPLGECDPDRIALPPTGDGGGGEDAAGAEVPALLDPLSPLAAFFARAGLYRDAAAELARAEKAAAPGERRAWITAYVAVDAPHHAVRAASRGLAWPPDAERLWRARAAYPEPFADLVRRVELERGLPRHLIAAIARKESLFDPRAVSRVGALGMMQMMPHTYETNRVRAGLPPLEPGRIPGPEASIEAAGYELEWLLGRFGGSLPLAIMGYNGGAAAVSRWLDRSGGLPMDVFVEKAGFAQTRNYVKRVYKNLVRYRLLDGEPLPDLPARAERAAVPSPADLPIPVAPDTPDPDGDPDQPGEHDD